MDFLDSHEKSMSTEITLDQLLAEQLKGFGGSDAAGYMGVGYGCRRRLYYKKTQTPVDYTEDIAGSFRDYEAKQLHTGAGTTLEAAIRMEYAKRTGRIVTVPEAGIFSDEHPHLLVHLDGAIEEDFNSDGPGVLEIKSLGEWSWDSFCQNGLYIGYQYQLQHALLTTGCKWGSFAIHRRLGNEETVAASEWEIRHWDVKADPAIQAKLLSESSFLWEMIQTKTEPLKLVKGDKRCKKCPWRDTCWKAESEEEMRSRLKYHRGRKTYHGNKVSELEKLLEFNLFANKETKTDE